MITIIYIYIYIYIPSCTTSLVPKLCSTHALLTCRQRVWSELSFSLIGCPTKPKEPTLLYCFTHWLVNKWIYIFFYCFDDSKMMTTLCSIPFPTLIIVILNGPLNLTGEWELPSTSSKSLNVCVIQRKWTFFLI